MNYNCFFENCRVASSKRKLHVKHSMVHTMQQLKIREKDGEKVNVFRQNCALIAWRVLTEELQVRFGKRKVRAKKSL